MSEMSRPDHVIYDMGIPSGHGAMDEKHDKGNRSPMLGNLPTDAGLVAPSSSTDGTGHGDSGYGGQ